MAFMDYEERHRLCSASVTLDGKRAKLVGVRADVAVVVTLDGTCSAEWSWRSAAHVVENGGGFRTGAA